MVGEVWPWSGGYGHSRGGDGHGRGGDDDGNLLGDDGDLLGDGGDLLDDGFLKASINKYLFLAKISTSCHVQVVYKP